MNNTAVPGTRRFVLVDRDGTIIVERHYLCDPEQVELLPNSANGLKFLQERGYGIIIVTNQSGIGRGYYTLAQAELVNERLRELLAAEGVSIDGIYVCPHAPAEDCRCRKPLPGMLLQAATEHRFIPAEAVVIGDKPCDIELALGVNASAVLVRTGYGREHELAGYRLATHIADDLLAAARWILEQHAIPGSPPSQPSSPTGGKP